jgi:two-component system, chemotaxis family, chemotaxis protein CheY
MIPRPCVLIVEDDDELRQIVCTVLEGAGYEVLPTANGREALDMLLSGAARPSLILLDLRMPVMDGWEFARVVRCYRRLADIPIVIIATPSVGARLHPRVDGLLPKPFSVEALLGEVARFAPLTIDQTA